MAGRLKRWKDDHVKPLFFQHKEHKPSEFQYLPLDKKRDEIRLLELLPGKHGESLEARLTHKSMEQAAGAYETVSYVWGNPEKTALIVMRGQVLGIPSNTAAALRRMRYSDRSRTLWIDAICINQKDVAERGEQVALMGSIYSRSRGNLVHLSDNEEMSRRICAVVYELDNDARNASNNYEFFDDIIWNDDNHSYRRSQRGELQNLDMEALMCLIVLPWFRRLWVLQEAYLAPSNTCFLGSEDLPLLTLLRSVQWANYATSLLSAVVQDEANKALLVSGQQCVTQMCSLLDFAGMAKLSGTMLLWTAVVFEKTDPKDAVYALLGLVNGAFDQLKPDYSKSLGSILQSATHATLRQNNNVDLLYTLDPSQEDIVDGQVSTWAFRADRQLGEEMYSTGLPYIHSDASAGLDEPSTFSVPQQDVAVLALQGIRVGTIAATSERCDEWSAEIIEQWFLNSIPALEVTVKELRSRHTAGSDYASCILDATLAGDELTRDDLELGRSWFQEIIDSNGGAPKFDSGNGEQEVDVFADMVQHFNFKSIRHRRMLVTSSGRIGLGPGAMQPGDVVAVLRGAKLPFILRPYGTDFKFVGAARVRGIMHGEAVAEHRAIGGKEEIFHVR